MKKRILFISSDGSRTGAPVFLDRFVRNLHDSGAYDLAVLFSRPGEIASSLSEDGFKTVVEQKTVEVGGVLTKLGLRIRYYFRYLLIIFRFKPDLVYSNTILNFGEVILAGALRIPSIVHVHEGRQIATRYKLQLKLSLIFARHIVSGSIYAQNVIVDLTRRQSTIIRNSVPRHNFVKKEVLIGNPPKLAVIGTINRNKGQHIAIQAVDELRRRGRKVVLRIAGQAVDKGYLQALKEQVRRLQLDDWVFFDGFVAKSDEFIRAADVLLVPSFDEVFPTVILEAFEVGTPVIASDVGGIPEMITDGVTGFLFRSGVAVDLADKIERILIGEECLPQVAATAMRASRQASCFIDQSKKIENLIVESLKPVNCGR